MVYKRIIVYIILGRLVKVVEFFPQILLVLEAHVHNSNEEHKQNDHQNSPEGDQNLLTLLCIYQCVVVAHSNYY